MSSHRLFRAAFKLLRIVFRGMGFLRLRFDRATQHYNVEQDKWCKDMIPSIVVLLVISAHFLLLVELADNYRALKEVQPDLSPPFDIVELAFNMCQDVLLAMLLIYCRMKRSQLWRAINEAQLCYKQLTSLLKKRFVLKYSRSMILMAVAQLLLLLLMCLKITWFDWPRLDLFCLIDFVMGAVRLLFVLVLTLQLFYHLLHAALLQSLNRMLKQQRNLKLLHRVLNLQPWLQRIQHLAARYFGILFCSFTAFLYLNCSAFIGLYGYNEQRYMLDENNPDEEMSRPPTREELLRVDSICVAWQMALMWLLLCAALLQQREQKKLIQGIWEMDFPSAVEASGLSKRGLIAKDLQSYLLTTRLPIMDYRRRSMNFLVWTKSASLLRIPLVDAASALKLLLQVMLFSSVVYLAGEGQL